MYVKCGHCKACLQEKAAKRVKRIEDTYHPDLDCYMVTLTYSRGTAPYILRSDAEKLSTGSVSSVDIYRDCKKRRVRTIQNGIDHIYRYRTKYDTVVLGSLDYIETPGIDLSTFNLKDLKGEPNKIGVCFYKDYQDFIARLRLNLKRIYGYEDKLLLYACSEYGTQSYRPHFHLLVFIKKSGSSFLRDAVITSWPFSNIGRFKRSFERCFKGASYVASYINQSSNFPLFLKIYQKQKHSYSKGFGLANKEYSLDKILQKIRNGYLAYSVAKQVGGYIRVYDVPLPSRVINRYFPKFKTSTRCAPCSLRSYLKRIIKGEFDEVIFNNDNPLFPVVQKSISVDTLYLNNDECKTIHVRLLNAFNRFKEDSPLGFDISLDNYIDSYISAWNVYNSTLLRISMLNPDVPFYEKYDNWDYVKFMHERDGFMVVGVDSYDMEVDPNKYSSVVNNTYLWTCDYNSNIKHKNVANAVYLAAAADCEL